MELSIILELQRSMSSGSHRFSSTGSPRLEQQLMCVGFWSKRGGITVSRPARLSHAASRSPIPASSNKLGNAQAAWPEVQLRNNFAARNRRLSETTPSEPHCQVTIAVARELAGITVGYRLSRWAFHRLIAAVPLPEHQKRRDKGQKGLTDPRDVGGRSGEPSFAAIEG